MNYRLLVDLEAVAVLELLPLGVRRRVLAHLVNLRSSPESLSDGYEQDAVGRRVEISFVAGHAVHYWIDSADRHIKVLEIRNYR